MTKKILVFICTFIAVFCINAILVYNMEASEKFINDSLKSIISRTDEIQKFLTKYKIGKNGIMEVSANYRGAHGENYPSAFAFNYELSDKLYLEDIDSLEYTSINFDKSILDFISKLPELNYLNPDRVIYKKQKKFDKINVTLDSQYLNEFFNTHFNDIELTIYTKGVFKKYDYSVLTLDNISIEFIDDEINVYYLSNTIKINFYDNSYHININNLLKANIIVNDAYSCSINIKDQVYYVEVSDDELYIKFNSQAAMYNSITISAKYDDVELEKSKELENIRNNPVANYVEASDYNIWR